MTYTLLQKTLEIPSIEKLQRAFTASRALTAADAQIIAKDAYGILVKGKSEAQAYALQRALLQEGIETEVAPDNAVPALPPTKFIRKLACGPDALLLHDPLGRPFPLEWRHIQMIGAGQVRVTEFKQIRSQQRIDDPEYPSESVINVSYSTKEQSKATLLLEIIVSRAVLRYSVEADKLFLASFLGDRFDPNLERSFALVIQELLRHAPQVTPNRGAMALRDGLSPVFYPTKNAFHEELIWMLWQMGKA